MSIAVIIPSYNAEQFVARAIQSVALQTRPPDQLIVVDDGSTDNTYKIAKAALSDLPFKTTIIRQENSGAGAARNAGVRATDQPYCAFLDADDQYMPDTLEQLFRAQTHYVSDALTFANQMHIDMSGNVLCADFMKDKLQVWGESARQYEHCHYLDGDRLFRSLIAGNYVSMSCFLIGTSLVEQHPFTSRRDVPEDRLFALSMARKVPFLYVPQILAQATRHDQNDSGTQNSLQNTRRSLTLLQEIQSWENAEHHLKAIKTAQSKERKILCYLSSQQGISTLLNDKVEYRINPTPKDYLRALISFLQ